jgi:putative ABC transport system ATP-binding protein
VLRAVGLRKAFRAPDGRGIEVLRGVDLTLEPGEHVAVVGRSGSGKSTLLNLIGCLDRADGGELWFGDVQLSRAGRRALARFRGRQLGFVFQAFNLIPALTAWENVMLAARYVGRDPRAAARAGELFERLAIADGGGTHLRRSGGEQQRVAFCRAVLNDPALILADEPTGNLDDDNAAVILRELRSGPRPAARPCCSSPTARSWPARRTGPAPHRGAAGRDRPAAVSLARETTMTRSGCPVAWRSSGTASSATGSRRSSRWRAGGPPDRAEPQSLERRWAASESLGASPPMAWSRRRAERALRRITTSTDLEARRRRAGGRGRHRRPPPQARISSG